MRKLLVGTSLALVAPAALAQSFNIDFDTTAASAGQGAPSGALKAAAGQSGIWDDVGSGSILGLLTDVSGASTSVSFARTAGSGSMFSASNAAINGDDEKLLEDMFRGATGQTIVYSISNLSAGRYALYTYAGNPTSFATTTVNVAGSTSLANQAIGASLSGPSYFVGATHALHVVDVAAGGAIQLTLTPPAPDGNVHLAGLQLVKLTTQRLRLHVDDSSSNPHHGGNWVEAFSNPTTALTTARYAGGANSEIWVASGFYKPGSTPDRFASFDIPNHVHFYGGFSGDETALSQRPAVGLTYLDGDIGADNIDSDNAYNVVVADNTAADTIIDGFRIHNGYNNDGGIGGGKGAGLRLQNGSATIRNCTFVNNNATSAGGGVYSDQGSPTLVDCFFYNDEAFEGSAVYHRGPQPIKLYNCEFMSNDAFEGTVKFDDSDGMVAGCWFHGNYAGASGGAVQTEGAGSGVTIVNCTLAGNTAGQWAGGLYVKNGADVVLRNSIFWENEAGFSGASLDAQFATTGAGSTISRLATIAQGDGGWPGSDPLFIDGDGADNNYGTFDDHCELQEPSPAIDLGNANSVPQDLGDVDNDGDTVEQLPLDIDGNPRVSGLIVDVGAFEFQQVERLYGDMNCDGLVTVSDIGGFVLAVTNPAGYAAAYPSCDRMNGDINQDGTVTVSDIGPFVALLAGG